MWNTSTPIGQKPVENYTPNSVLEKVGSQIGAVLNQINTSSTNGVDRELSPQNIRSNAAQNLTQQEAATTSPTANTTTFAQFGQSRFPNAPDPYKQTRHDYFDKGNISQTKTTDPSLPKEINKTATKAPTDTQQRIDIGTAENAQTLGTILEKSIQSNNSIAEQQHTEQPKSILQSEIGKTATHTTVTKEISSGNHPHLDEEISTKVQKIVNHTPPKNEHVDEFIKRIKHENFLKKEINGEYPIDFKKLGLSKEEIKEAGIKGKIFKNAKGEFDFEITGRCSSATVKCLEVLNQKLKKIQKNDPNFKNIEINIEPKTAGPLNANDLNVLENHGLIKYKILLNPNLPSNNQIMKLILDPGKNEKDDGLTVAIYDGIYEPAISTKLSKIPLEVVFEGNKFNERPGITPLLPNWRNDKLFELSSSSKDAQEILWKAVDDYLKVSVETTEGHNDADNKETQPNIQANEQNEDLSSASNTSALADLKKVTTISENQQGEIYSNQLQMLSEKAKQGNLTEQDVEGFRKTLPAPVQNYLNKYLNVNNIKSISLQGLCSAFEKLTPEDCQKIGYVIAHEITPKDIKTIKFETEIIEIENADISKLKAPIESQENFIDQLKIIENLADKSNNQKLTAIIKNIKTKINKNNYNVLLSAITEFKNGVDELLKLYKNEALLTINLGQIYELCNSLNSNFDVVFENYKLKIEELLNETNAIKKTTKGFDLLSKLTKHGIQNNQITNKIEKLMIIIEGDDNNINKLLELLKIYNSQKPQHYATEEEYLKAFADWIKE